MNITIHIDVKRASDTFRFPFNALNSTIRAAINEYKKKYDLLLFTTYVDAKYNLEYLFIYLKDKNNVPYRIDVKL